MGANRVGAEANVARGTMTVKRISDEAIAAMNRLADELVLLRAIRSAPVNAAFRAVPWHLFLDRFVQWMKNGKWRWVTVTQPPASRVLRWVYQNEPLMTRIKPPLTSSFSQPSLMAEMLKELELSRGLRVLEVGAGTGYNAALIAHIVGAEGKVVTIDNQRDVVREARRHLRRAGFPRVRVLCGDGALGAPDDAPFDRVIVTASCSDLAPTWVEQLNPHGVILFPLVLNGVSGIFQARKEGRRLTGRYACSGGFMPLLSDVLPQASSPQKPDGDAALKAILSRRPRARRFPWAGLRVAPQGDSRAIGSGGGDFFLFAVLSDSRAMIFNAADVPAPLQREKAPTVEYGVAALWDAKAKSLCLCFQRGVVVYGSPAMYDRLGDLFRAWLSFGAPQATDWSVHLVPKSLTDSRAASYPRS